MKRISYLFSLLFLMSFVLFTGCKGTEPEPETAAQINAKALAGTYIVTSATREDVAVDLGATPVTLVFGANPDGLGGAFKSTNAGVLPGDADLPANSTWKWPNGTTTFDRIIIDGTTLNLTTDPGASPMVFTYTADDEKPGTFTATVTANKQ